MKLLLLKTYLYVTGYPIVNDPLYNSPAFGPNRGKGGKYDRPVEEVGFSLTIIYLLTLDEYLDPHHENGQGIKCYPCLYFRLYVHPSHQRRRLSKFNCLDPNFKKLVYIQLFSILMSFSSLIMSCITPCIE